MLCAKLSYGVLYKKVLYKGMLALVLALLDRCLGYEIVSDH